MWEVVSSKKRQETLTIKICFSLLLQMGVITSTIAIKLFSQINSNCGIRYRDSKYFLQQNLNVKRNFHVNQVTHTVTMLDVISLKREYSWAPNGWKINKLQITRTLKKMNFKTSSVFKLEVIMSKKKKKKVTF